MIKRKTIQCTLVLEAVNNLKCHATADEVYDLIVKEHPSISRATVYRNLQQLCELDKIKKIEVPEGADRFDHNCYNHYHVRCVQCGGVFDVDMEYIPNIENQIKDNHGFEFVGHDIMFKGICSKCKSLKQ